MKSLLFISLLMIVQSAAAANYKWLRTPRKDLRGQALVAHGLNSDPAKMESIARELNKRGHDVLLLALSGHEDHDKADLNKAVAHKASFSEWFIELNAGLDLITQENRRKGGMTSFVAFSTSTMLGLTALARAPINIVDQMVLFAPPVTLKLGAGTLMKAASLLFNEHQVLPTKSASREHIIMDGPKAGGLKVLFEAMAEFKNTPKSSVNVPTVIFIDPNDEIVDMQSLRNLAGWFSDWQIIEVSIKGSKINKSQHSVYAPELLGPNQWETKVLPELDRMFGR